ncbi:MAG TPA: phosphate acyltransferase PlsX [Syntrophomonadaceae bacterium]|nr:phosphate acyltransferase PlsX [Syntrophomonadaceae bacterium]HNX27786.1 phosphate acyltransferase PlsX [Syntrophomonadaceae bacterium]HPR93578.1 phosphate acyltransferase PlsX [Syntrophomonadaceae bacterium]
MKIAVDVMGGDHAPREIIAGALKWSQEAASTVLLVGKEAVINEELINFNYNPAWVEIVNAAEVIGMEESPALALRRKKDASIVVATKLVKEKRADCLLSCGSTGAQMAAAIFILGRMEGIERPPLITAIPNLSGAFTFLIDLGASVDCKSKQLVQFAFLGSAYAQLTLNIKNPRTALLSNGTEETKGNSITVEAHNLLKQQKNINFIGNVEGRDIFNNSADVIVCDGFTGNIVLKTIEGLAAFIAEAILKETGKLPQLFKQLDYTQIGGAPLLGVEGISIVCHGSSKREAVYNGMRIAEKSCQDDIVTAQKKALSFIEGND